MEETGENKFMKRCLELALCAQGMTYPNPLVGSVIVSRGEIIGEGYHRKAGLPHAEVNAIDSVADRSRLKDATLYVNLEPCSHFGKTPPCADLIIASSIPRVVVGTVDTSARVNGEGIARLRKSGCDVRVGVLEEECRRINRRFFTFHEKKRPWIILKWAQSADGFLDTMRSPDEAPSWISGKPERVLVHKWRSVEQSILAGAGTIRADRPRLNVREWSGSDPKRLVLSSSGSFPAGDIGRFTVFTHNAEASFPGNEVVILDKNIPSCIQVADWLYRSGIQSLFVEGGAMVLNHFLSNNMWDEARVFTGTKEFRNGVRAPEIQGKMVSEDRFAESFLRILSNDFV